MNAKQLEEYFSQYGDIKSLKISLNADHSSRGYGFVCFQAPESSKKALDDTVNKDANVGVKYQPKDKRDFRRIFNNIYVKNLPMDFTEEKLRELFSAHGRIESCKLCSNDKGTYAFVCYNSEDKEDREYGPKAAAAAVQGLNNKEIDGNKLYVKEALKKESRAIERTREMLKYKNSKKRCNLYVKNFPPKTTEEELKKRFEEFGEIESLKMFSNDKGENVYAFVCFKTPDQASIAKTGLHNQIFCERPLYINHYEIKEFREISLEEAKDKATSNNTELTTVAPTSLTKSPQDPTLCPFSSICSNFCPERTWVVTKVATVTSKVEEVVPTIPQPENEPGYDAAELPEHASCRSAMMMQQQQQPQPQAQPMPQMPQPMAQMPQAMPQPMQQLTPEQMDYQRKASSFLTATSRIMPSIQEANHKYKEQVGNCIYDFVLQQVGQERAPKVTGMLIDLPIEEIKMYMANFD
eukprot:CAMPEP_0116882214 /NCGR_PEP_ID=MMETSP0463-20121206/14409_1 /TAXON_ID=181622 /ORGANISM="Strombidinopsis sp, Strain SopsisLIS2011" /LENGTH=465 /DNA_ID=CAMNT_0004535101 /DNA_START=398 /DNA_END=1798 /DNA_ORIENTATION=+